MSDNPNTAGPVEPAEVTERVTAENVTAEAAEGTRAAGRRGLRGVLDRIGAQNLILVIAIVVLATFLTSQNRMFLSASNLVIIAQAVTIVGLLATVQTVVMIMGGIDLTVGSCAGLASVFSAMVFTWTSSSIIGIAAALALGALCGLVNAVVVVFGRIPPMIATLAGYTAFKGVAQLISNGRAQGYTGKDFLFKGLAQGRFIGLPTLVWVLIATALIIHIVLRFTKIGRNIYAVGGNDRAARLSGIDINRYIIGVFVLSGVVTAIAGILITARTGSGQPVSGSEGLEFQSITAAALGGVALRGGKGSVGGTILAVVLLGILLNGMVLLNVNTFWQNIAQGTLLIVAVVLQQLRSGEQRVGLPK
jgi:ribose transport system permease protein